MNKTVTIAVLLLLFSCNEKKGRVKLTQEQIIRNEITNYLKIDLEEDSIKFQSIQWGNLDSIDALGFKYKIRHKYKTKGISLSAEGIKDTIIVADNIFHLDSNLNIVSFVNSASYSRYFDSSGLPFNSFGNRALQRIGIANGYSMVLNNQAPERLIIIGGNKKIVSELNMAKSEWVQENLKSAERALIERLEIIEHCEDESGEECTEYVFKDGHLKEINAQNN